MRVFRFTLCVLLTALSGTAITGAASATTARTSSFSGQVCSLLTSTQVKAVHVAPLKCTAQKPIKGSGSTIYYANWGSTGGLGPHLAVSISAYTDATGFQQAKANLGHLPNAQKLSGIGSVAYESTGSSTTHMLNFVIGKYVCDLGLQTKQPVKSVAALATLAKAIAAKL